jgi:hypothetical protein
MSNCPKCEVRTYEAYDWAKGAVLCASCCAFKRSLGRVVTGYRPKDGDRRYSVWMGWWPRLFLLVVIVTSGLFPGASRHPLPALTRGPVAGR